MMLRCISMYSAQLCAFLFLSVHSQLASCSLWVHLCKNRATVQQNCWAQFLPETVCLHYLPYAGVFGLFFSFSFRGLGKSAVQLFRELSNPAFDLSCAVKPNRIVVLTPMTIPPAVAEPPVGHQLKCACGGRVRRVEGLTDRERDRNRLTGIGREDLCDAQSEATEEEAQRRKTPEVHYFWTTTSSILLSILLH